MRRMSVARTATNVLCKTFASALLITSLLAPASFAQSQGRTEKIDQSIKGAVLKGKAPVNKEVLKVTLPKPEETTLKNGLQVVVLERHKVPTFAMQMVILSGGFSDPKDERGVAEYTASLLREGTKTRNSKEIAEAVDSMGASLNAGSGLASSISTVSASGLTDNLDQVMDLFSDVVLNPTYPKDEVAKYKARQLAQLQFIKSLPQFLSISTFRRAIYGDHPAGLLFPAKEDVEKITPEDLVRFHSTYYRPNNAILAVVGDVTMKEMLPKIERAFGYWERGDVPPTVIPPVPAPQTARLLLVDRPGSVQTDLIMGVQSIVRTDPDYFPLVVMDKVVGGGPAARLFMNLREDKGYTYGAYSGLSAVKYRGTWAAQSQVRTPVTDGAMHEFMYELNRIRDEKVPETELDNAKTSIVGSFALSLEQPNELLQNIILQKIYNLPSDYWDTYPRKIQGVTADDIQRVARKYIDLGHLQIVAVGDSSKIEQGLEKYAKVEVYDANGKLIKSAEGKAAGAGK